MIDILILLLGPSLLWESNPARYWYLTPIVFVAWVVDMAIAHSTWAVITGWPQKNEWTVSHTLERLCVDYQNPDHHLFVQIAKKINRVSPTHDHIKAVL